MEIKYMLFALLLGLPLISVVGAANVGPGLMASMTDVNCKVTFMNGYMSAIINADSNTSSILTPQMTTLTNDAAQLQQFVNNNDTSDYSSYIRGTFDVDARGASGAIVTARQGMNRTIRQSLKTTYTTLHDTYTNCTFSAEQQFAQAKVTLYNQELSDYQSKITTLSAKGVDTTDLSTLVSNAQSQIVTPLSSAISGAQDPVSLRTAINSYCLFDGCDNGTNFHFEANFESEKLNDIINLIQTNATSDGLGTEVSAAQSELSAGTTALQSVGTSQYTTTSQAAVWNNIEATANTVIQILHDMRSASHHMSSGNSTNSS